MIFSLFSLRIKTKFYSTKVKFKNEAWLAFLLKSKGSRFFNTPKLSPTISREKLNLSTCAVSESKMLPTPRIKVARYRMLFSQLFLFNSFLESTIKREDKNMLDLTDKYIRDEAFVKELRDQYSRF